MCSPLTSPGHPRIAQESLFFRRGQGTGKGQRPKAKMAEGHRVGGRRRGAIRCPSRWSVTTDRAVESLGRTWLGGAHAESVCCFLGLDRPRLTPGRRPPGCDCCGGAERPSWAASSASLMVHFMDCAHNPCMDTARNLKISRLLLRPVQRRVSDTVIAPLLARTIWPSESSGLMLAGELAVRPAHRSSRLRLCEL